jgi:hypothetical protein
MKIVYIAGPYIGDGTVKSIEINIREAEKYQIALANKQIGFFCAHNHTEHFGNKAEKASEKFYHELDMQFLKRVADAVLAVPNWKSSSGARKEVEWAQESNLPIFFPKSTDDIEEIIKWNKE